MASPVAKRVVFRIFVTVLVLLELYKVAAEGRRSSRYSDFPTQFFLVRALISVLYIGSLLVCFFLKRIGVYLFLGVNLLPFIFLTWTGLTVPTEEMHVFFAFVFVVLAFLNRTEFQPVFKRSEGSANRARHN